MFVLRPVRRGKTKHINTLNTKLNPILHLLALLGAHPILHVSRVRVKYIFIFKHSGKNVTVFQNRGVNTI